MLKLNSIKSDKIWGCKVNDVDIPDFGAPARFLKQEAEQDYIDYYYANGRYVEVSVCGVDADYGDAYLATLEAANWLVIDSSKEGFAKDAISEGDKLRISLVYDTKTSVLTARFDIPNAGPAYLSTIASLLEVPGGAYAFEEDDGEYLTVVVVDSPAGSTTEEKIANILDIYGAKLNGKSGFELKGSRSAVQTSGNFTYVYEQYVSADLGAKVYLFGIYNSSSGKYTLQVEAMEYVTVPSYYLPVIEFFGLEPDTFNAEPAEGLEPAYIWTQVQHSGMDLDSIMKIYTDKLDADTTFGFTCSLPTETVTMSTGGEGRRAVYVCDGYKVELYAPACPPCARDTAPRAFRKPSF